MELFTFWALESVRRDAKSSHSPKAMGKCPRRKLHYYEGHAKKGQGQVTKGDYRIKVTSKPFDTCVVGHFAQRWLTFDPLTSSDLAF